MALASHSRATEITMMIMQVAGLFLNRDVPEARARAFGPQRGGTRPAAAAGRGRLTRPALRVACAVAR
jgi:hypothetical protein